MLPRIRNQDSMISTSAPRIPRDLLHGFSHNWRLDYYPVRVPVRLKSRTRRWRAIALGFLVFGSRFHNSSGDASAWTFSLTGSTSCLPTMPAVFRAVADKQESNGVAASFALAATFAAPVDFLGINNNRRTRHRTQPRPARCRAGG